MGKGQFLPHFGGIFSSYGLLALLKHTLAQAKKVELGQGEECS